MDKDRLLLALVRAIAIVLRSSHNRYVFAYSGGLPPLTDLLQGKR